VDVRPARPPSDAGTPAARWRLVGRASYQARDVWPGRIRPVVLRLPGRHVVVITGTAEWLRHIIARPGSASLRAGHRAQSTDRTVSKLRFIVLWWRAPRQGWSGRLGAVEGLARHRFRLPARTWGPAMVSVSLNEPSSLREVGLAMLRVLEPVPLNHPPLEPAPLEPAPLGSVPPAEPDSARTAIVVDAGLINPRGRRRTGYAGTARLDIVGAARWPSANSRVLARGQLDGVPLDPRALEVVRTVGAVDFTGPDLDTDPVAVATLLVQVAAAGGALQAPSLPPQVTDLLAPELAALVTTPLPSGRDPFEVELRSVAVRRAALRHHGRLGRPPSVSAVLVTHRRDYLAGILDAIAGQTYPDLEIVLGLHGLTFTDADLRLLRSYGRAYEVIEAPSGLSFGEVMGLATGRAHGHLLSKFDDDDTYGPEHVWDLVLARHYTGATLVGKGAEFVHLESLGKTVRRSSGRAEWPAEVVAGGTMLLARGDLEAVGGWRPVPRSVDRGLIDRLVHAGAHVHRTHPLGYVYHRRAHGHTWVQSDDYFLRTASAQWAGLPPYPEFGSRNR